MSMMLDDCDENMGLLTAVPDDVLASAYEAVDASLRARLKTNIAMHHSMFGTAPSLQVTHTERATAGFALAERRRSVSWTVVILAEDFASGPRLVAALMPALLAGVEDVHVVRVAGATSLWPEALLATLELIGQEQAASATLDDAAAFVQGKAGSGRVLFLGGDAQCKSRIAHTVVKMSGVAFWAEDHAPRIYIDNAEDFDAELIRWAHPDVVFCDAAEKADVVVRVGDEATLHAHTSALLALDKGCEALWMYPSLRQEFFIQQSVTIALFE